MINREARRKLEDFKVPDVSKTVIRYRLGRFVHNFDISKVMEYVNERASLYELTKTVKAWERKVEIAEVWSYIGVLNNCSVM